MADQHLAGVLRRGVRDQEQAVAVAGLGGRADRGDHEVHGLLRDQLAAHEGLIEAGDVRGGGVHRGGRGEDRLVDRFEGLGLVRTHGRVLHLGAADEGAVLEAGAVHAGRAEDAVPDELGHPAAGDGLDHHLHHHVARVGVAVVGAGLEPPVGLLRQLDELTLAIGAGDDVRELVEVQLEEGLAAHDHPDGVRHAGGVVQEHREGDPVLDVGPQAREDVTDRGVQGQGAALDLLQGDGGDHALGDRGDPGHRVRPRRRVRVQAAGAGGGVEAAGRAHHGTDGTDGGPLHDGVEGGLDRPLVQAAAGARVRTLRGGDGGGGDGGGQREAGETGGHALGELAAGGAHRGVLSEDVTSITQSGVVTL